MVAGEGFSVDLAALVGAARAVQQLTAELDAQQVKDLDGDRSAFGHDRLAATVGDFCDRWDQGVRHLAADGHEIEQRLGAAAVTYAAAEQAAREALERIALPAADGGASPPGLAAR